ncbi:IS110 family transposase [Pseudomonas fluorescens]|nr:IS110 family transposase [Pseudomonas fluorescens]
MPGIGEVLATVIMLETGDIERFADVGNFASYARCIKSAHYSNGKKKGRRQHQERQRLLDLGVYRSGEFCSAFQ